MRLFLVYVGEFMGLLQIKKKQTRINSGKGSFAGWLCLYALFYRSQTMTLGIFDVFLGTVAVVGVSGFSYKIVNALDQ